MESSEAGGGGHIHYEVGIHLDEKQEEFWNLYTAENREKYFWMFLNSFVGKWQSKVNIGNFGFLFIWTMLKVIPNWEMLVTSRLSGGKEIGPALEKLPEELLPALSKFLFIGKDEIEQGQLGKETLEQCDNIVKCLTIVCLNTFNIPLVSSMNFVTLITQLNNNLLQQLLEMESAFFSNKVHKAVSTQNLRSLIIHFIVESCHFLETLYDPFFRWRAYLCGKDSSSLHIEQTPVSVHPEIIPFLYESFETALVDCFPELAYELLTVFGALLSGASHNAVKVISPATSKMLLKTVRDSATSQEVHINAIYCSSKSIQILHNTPMEERQLDIKLLLDQYQQILLSLTSKEEACLATLIEGIALLSRVLDVDNNQELQEQFAKAGLIPTLMRTIEECRLPPDQKRSLVPVIISRISLLLRGCSSAQMMMEKQDGYRYRSSRAPYPS